MYFQQNELQAFNAEHGILTQAWSPIGGVTSYTPGATSVLENETLRAIAADQGKSVAQVMLAWALAEGRAVVPKSTKPERIVENFDIDFELTADQIAAIDALDTGVRGGPEADFINLTDHAFPIPEA